MERAGEKEGRKPFKGWPDINGLFRLLSEKTSIAIYLSVYCVLNISKAMPS